MKFTSEDLLKAMGLKLGDEVAYLDRKGIIVMGSSDIPMIDVETVGKCYLDVLLKYDYTIIQHKPTLTEDEKVILRNLPKDCNFIARDLDNSINVFEEKPKRQNTLKFWLYKDETESYSLYVFEHLFQFIKWEDEPYSIEKLLKD